MEEERQRGRKEKGERMMAKRRTERKKRDGWRERKERKRRKIRE